MFFYLKPLFPHIHFNKYVFLSGNGIGSWAANLTNKIKKKEGWIKVTIVDTDRWLEESLNEPLELLKKTKKGKEDEISFYRYLQKHGMYRPSSNAVEIYKQMKERNVWKKFKEFENTYKKRWNGPNVPIYLFPVQERRGLFQPSIKKSGVCFKEEIYLFLTEQKDYKEYEALFVHEYHHCTRMALLNRKDEQYSLLDSIVFEGLAEHAVREYCGEKYVSSWVNSYEDKDMESYIKRWIKPNLDIRSSNPHHDQLLLGQKSYPKMLGYAAGYYLIKMILKKKKLSTVHLLGKPSTFFLTKEREWLLKGRCFLSSFQKSVYLPS